MLHKGQRLMVAEQSRCLEKGWIDGYTVHNLTDGNKSMFELNAINAWS